MTATALSLITRAFEILNCFMPGDPIPPADAESARGFLNLLVSSWAVQSLTIPAIARETFSLVAGKGGPSNPYTIGIGGSFDTVRPSTQGSITGAGLLLNTSDPVVEIPRNVITDNAYRSIRVKELQSVQFTHVYYNPTFVTGNLGTINLWPVPNTPIHSLALYLLRPLAVFADLNTTYQLPDGADDALVYNLAKRLAKPWGSVVDDDLKLQASLALMIFKRGNLKMSDLANDLARTSGRYDIELGINR